MEALVSWLERVVVMLVKALSDWTEEEVKLLAARQVEVRAFLCGTTTPKTEKGMSTEAQLSRWVKLYREIFGLKLDPASVKLPKRKKGFDRLIVVHPGITYAKLIDFFRTKFNVYLYTEDLNADILDCRKADGELYAIWVRASREADKENCSKSAHQFSQKDCETLLERLLHELCHFLETGEHLDVGNRTICAGSRDGSGCVPDVRWNSATKQLCVDWCGAAECSLLNAVRSVVR